MIQGLFYFPPDYGFNHCGAAHPLLDEYPDIYGTGESLIYFETAVAELLGKEAGGGAVRIDVSRVGRAVTHLE